MNGPYKDFLEEFEGATTEEARTNVLFKYVRSMLNRGWRVKDALDKLEDVAERQGLILFPDKDI